MPRVRLGAIALLLTWVCRAFAADRSDRELERAFVETVHPFLETYCFACHGKEKQKGKLDLSSYSTTQAVAADFRRWDLVLAKLKAEEMPPEEAKQHPAPEQRRGIIEWIQTLRQREARRNAGDPGPVLARRLSNAEYNYTIRDLTGVDIRPALEFPVDPANEAGFDNSGESLAMSPALLKKYLEAARRTAEHVVLKPDGGFAFAPHPVITETDRDKYCVKRIVDFYRRQPTNLADYFMTAWRFEHRRALGRPKATLADFAATDKVSSKYLATIWSALAEDMEEIGPMAILQSMWRQLPAPGGGQPEVARPGCERMRDFVLGLRPKLRPEVANLTVRGIAAGSQPLVLWKDRQYAANRRRFDRGALPIKIDPGSGKPATNTLTEPALRLPAGESARARYEAAFDRFCRVFPDAFYVSERGRVFLKEDTESEGRLLSAGFHLMTGYFRDDAPLAELILDERDRRELDELW